MLAAVRCPIAALGRHGLIPAGGGGVLLGTLAGLVRANQAGRGWDRQGHWKGGLKGRSLPLRTTFMPTTGIKRTVRLSPGCLVLLPHTMHFLAISMPFSSVYSAACCPIPRSHGTA